MTSLSGNSSRSAAAGRSGGAPNSDPMTALVPVDRRTAANRKNARSSTGPQTVDGKARSSRNAVKHGLFSKTPLAPGEDPEAFEALARGFFESLQPVGAVEVEIVVALVTQSWRLRRIRALEVGLFVHETAEVEALASIREAEEAGREATDEVTFTSDMDRFVRELDPPVEEVKDPDSRAAALVREAGARDRSRKVREIARSEPVAGAFIRQAREADAFLKLARYEAAIERSQLRMLHELERLQDRRLGD